MRPEDVARYLQDHPEFFEEHAEVLAEIQIPHPHGGSAIPLSERQIVSLREKIRVLEAKLRELVQFGEENDALGERVHRAAIELIKAPGLEAMLRVIYYNLREDFAVPHSALRIWRASGNTPEFGPVSDPLKRYAQSLGQPYCGPSGNAEAAAWFGEGASHVRSVVHVALRDKECFGMLALGSEDVLRFYPEMGTLYLERLGGVAGAALLRFL